MEAINFMFRYYRQANECYVYLADSFESDDFKSSASSCRWWIRGWTLQELLAPASVLFFSSNWLQIGSKMEHAGVISEITAIPEEVLLDEELLHLSDYSVAAKMSWASSRQTTRIEDTAYYLLGLFNVNMPLIYGEGRSAFRRLQEEIVKRSNDLTILASANDSSHPQLFADSPSSFSGMSGLERFPNTMRDFSVTNKGLRFSGECPLRLCGKLSDDCRSEIRILVLLLGFKTAIHNAVGLCLRKSGPKLFRKDPELALITLTEPGIRQIASIHVTDIYILMDWRPEILLLEAAFRNQAIHVPRHSIFELEDVVPESLWDYDKRLF